MESPRSGAERRGFDSPQQEAFLNLWRTYDRLKAVEEELFAQYTLSAQQYNSLRLLRSWHPGSLPTLALAQRLISRAPDITRMLDKLEQRRLIERERRAENRRVVEIRITEEGIALLKQMADAVKAMHARQLGHLADEDLKELVRLLRKARGPHEDATCDWLDER